ncbi:hypothetical protein EDC19_2621 [Natranaerovirga hydrolytica]|uniref:Uncharacterized protein n=1 Tax=Natranaerovirga hydrolytica TaxID=680378 RepID=A0A4R1MAJ6_9FIRM|nr:DUF2161 family putative PD-(D/E)XK-type phosphodiesterase [Natranaerovirga hydrolytica]TCK87974.1 hypothetical protein EDC19_2621 [Natranaerovirga hydrolytica]
MTKIKEVDLYQPIKDYFEEKGYEVKGEVLDCDVVASKEEELIVTELKKQLNLEVILQGVKRQEIANGVYVAVIKNHDKLENNKYIETIKLLKRLNLGLFLITIRGHKYYVEELLTPQKMTQTTLKNKKLKEEFLSRSGDYNIGGSTRKKIITAYKEKTIHIATLLATFGPLQIKELVRKGTDKNKTGPILRKNYYGWFEKVERGIYGLSKIGKEDLKNYDELCHIYLEEIEDVNCKNLTKKT